MTGASLQSHCGEPASTVTHRTQIGKRSCTLVAMGKAPLFVGCCGWTEAQARYVRDFTTIELQTTFYEPPSITLARRWRAQAPPEFRFCMKAWQLITHTPASPTYRRLKSAVSPTERDLYGSFRPTEQVWLAWQRTKEVADVLRAEVIVFQCPRSFLPSSREYSQPYCLFPADRTRSPHDCLGAARK